VSCGAEGGRSGGCGIMNAGNDDGAEGQRIR
jgi:hypothetical protein